MMRKDSYGVPDIAELLNIGDEQARRILRAGKIKGARLTGKHYTVTNASLLEYLGKAMYNGLIDFPQEEDTVQ